MKVKTDRTAFENEVRIAYEKITEMIRIDT